MLTLKNILMFEALARKPFAKLDGKDVDDVLMLMYVCKYDQRKYTYSVWSEVYKKYQQNDVAKFGREISEDIAYCNQYQAPSQPPQGEESKQDEEIYYTQIIGRVMTDGGMDSEWVLSQPFEMLPILAQMVQEHEERRIDNERFWAFILTSPYRDKKSDCKTPQKWLPMPFDDKRRNKGKVTDEEADMARAFFANLRKQQNTDTNGKS